MDEDEEEWDGFTCVYAGCEDAGHLLVVFVLDGWFIYLKLCDEHYDEFDDLVPDHYLACNN